MGIKTALNLNSVLIILLGLLFAFFSWASSGWIGKVEASMNASSEVRSKLSSLESTGNYKWQETDRRLDQIEKKLDILISRR